MSDNKALVKGIRMLQGIGGWLGQQCVVLDGNRDGECLTTTMTDCYDNSEGSWVVVAKGARNSGRRGGYGDGRVKCYLHNNLKHLNL